MTNQEFSNEFDILYNNIASNQAPGLDNYEKSVFLTSAQESLVLEILSGKNPFGDSFEKTEEVRKYLSDIIETTEMTKYEGSDIMKLTDKSVLYNIPDDLWYTTYETVKFKDSNLNCTSNKVVEVTPVTQDEFSRILKNPFRKPSTTRVLRLDVGGKIELVSEYDIQSYIVRYVKVLEPIILEDLPEELSIKGISQETNCKLNPALHEAILGRAVQLAKESLALNNLSKRINVLNRDVKGVNEVLGQSKIDLVLCNPPFFKVNEHSNLNDSDAKTYARHEVLINLEDVIKAASMVLKDGGYFAMVHRPERLKDILMLLSLYHLEPSRLQFVYPKMGKNANHILIEARKGANKIPNLQILSPLFVYDENNRWTNDILKIYNYKKEE
jgi:tRNA1(Val) A37 N6-methylase TrmN6